MTARPSEFATIECRIEGNLGWITINRPKVLNAISPQMRDEMSTAFDHLEAEPNVRAIILAGTAESRAFSTGHDINFDPPPGSSPYVWRKRQVDILDWEMRVWKCSKPVVAQVHGYCLGGACEIVMFADIVIASDDAQFGEPEVRFMAGPPALIMPWIIGIKRAKRLLMTGETIDAETARQWGMIDEVVPRDQLPSTAERWARRLAAFPPEVMHYTKVAINRAMEAGGVHATLTLGNELNVQLEATPTEIGREFQRRKDVEGVGAALNWLKNLYTSD